MFEVKYFINSDNRIIFKYKILCLNIVFDLRLCIMKNKYCFNYD